MITLWDQPHRKSIVDWLLSHGYVREGVDLYGIAWSKRSGYDFTDLMFYPLARHATDIGCDAIIGRHASGTNPRMHIGTCETLEEVQEVHDLIRRLNGYKQPEPELQVAEANHTAAPTSVLNSDWHSRTNTCS